MLLTVMLIIISFSSPTLLFHSRLKTLAFSANPSNRSLFFSSSELHDYMDSPDFYSYF